MEIASSCPFPVTSVVWQSHSGGWALTLVCKATFRLEAQEAVLAEQQESFNDEDNHWNDDPARSLVAPSDLVPFKPRADVLVVGHAFAADRMPVRTLTACITVGQMSKALEVWCDRWFDMEGRVHEGSRFVKMPLRWERAAGGPDSVNPVGLRFDAEPDAYGRVMIPNLQPLGAHVGWRGDRFDPVGFGPIAPHWPARRGRLHGHAAGFSPRDWTKQPLPAIDFGYFNAAPLDQQVESIRADERITLENLHRDHPRIVTRLPGIHPRAVVDRAQGGRQELRLVADTLWIDTDRALCTVVWRGGIGLHHAHDAGTIHVAVERPGPAVAVQIVQQTPPLPDHAERPSMRQGPARSDPTVTLAPGLEPSSEETLPFMQSPWVESPYARSEADQRPREEAGETLFLLPDMAAAGKATLPFPPVASKDREGRGVKSALLGVEAPADVPLGPVAEARAAGPVVSFGNSPMGLGSSAVVHGSPGVPQVGPRAEVEDTQAGLPLAEGMPSPPPMIGPLARPDIEVAALPHAAEAAKELPPEVPEPLLPTRPRAPPKPDLEQYPIERSAKITVAIACRPADTAKVLEEHHLSASDWDYVKNQWLEAIRQELGHGRNELLKRYDAAYVEQAEAERGPIGVEEYARLSVASERGRVGDAVAEMGLPAGAPIRIERVWMEKMARDAPLGEKLREAVERQRVA